METIRRIASGQGYSPNLQARGLRQARSGLVGMIIPLHDNRYFSSMSQSFEAEARARGQVPVIASSMRDPREEIRIIETLISYAVESVFIAGAADPEAITRQCRAGGLRHVFVDLPGKGAPSVISDNYQGSASLTRQLLSLMQPQGGPARNRLYFLGGVPTDYGSSRRIEAFRDICAAAGQPIAEDQIISCGYSPKRAMQETAALMARLGGLPAGLFINSLTAFEGVLGHFVNLPPQTFDQSVIGCYDYDPFAAYLQFPVHMVRQDSHRLIEQAYQLMDKAPQDPVVIEVAPQLIPPRTIYAGPFSERG